MIEFTIKTLDSTNHPFSVDDEITIQQLKDKIFDQIGMEADVQRLIFCGKVMQDDKKLSEYDVNGKVVHLVQRAPPSLSSRPNPGSSNAANNSDSGGGQQQQQQQQQQPQQPYRRLMFPISQDFETAVFLEALSLPGMVDGLAENESTGSPTLERMEFMRRMIREIKRKLVRLEAERAQSSDSARTAQEATAENTPLPDLPEIDISMDTDSMPLTPPWTRIADYIQDQDSGERGGDSTRAAGPRNAAETGAQGAGATGTQGTQGSRSFYRRRVLGGRTPARPRDLGDLMEEMAYLQERLTPFYAIYMDALRAPSDEATDIRTLAEVQRIQRVAEHVAEIMHNMAHAYHALSDIRLTVGQRACRLASEAQLFNRNPFPIQAQINFLSERQRQQTGNPQAATGNAQAPPQMDTTNAQPETAPGTNDNPQPNRPTNQDANVTMPPLSYHVEIETTVPIAFSLNSSSLLSNMNRSGQTAQGQTQAAPNAQQQDGATTGAGAQQPPVQSRTHLNFTAGPPTTLEGALAAAAAQAAAQAASMAAASQNINANTTTANGQTQNAPPNVNTSNPLHTHHDGASTMFRRIPGEEEQLHYYRTSLLERLTRLRGDLVQMRASLLAGPFPWGGPPNADMLQNIVNTVMQRGLIPGIPGINLTPNAASTQPGRIPATSTVTSQTASGQQREEATAGRRSANRGTGGVPRGVRTAMGGGPVFDRFLPCDSIHLPHRHPMRRPQPQNVRIPTVYRAGQSPFTVNNSAGAPVPSPAPNAAPSAPPTAAPTMQPSATTNITMTFRDRPEADQADILPGDLELLSEFFAAVDQDPDISWVRDVFIIVSRELTLSEILRTVNGQGASLGPLRSPLQEFLRRILRPAHTNRNSYEIPIDRAYEQAADQLLDQQVPFIRRLGSSVPLRQGINIEASIRALFRARLPSVLRAIMSTETEEDGEEFTVRITAAMWRLIVDLCCLLQHCCLNGFEDVRYIYCRYVEYLTGQMARSVGVLFDGIRWREELQPLLGAMTRSTLASIAPRLNCGLEAITPYIVLFNTQPSAPPMSPSPMDVTPQESPKEETPKPKPTTTRATETNRREIPVNAVPMTMAPRPITNNSELTMNAPSMDIPNNWAPIVAEDQERQRQQAPQPPFSDAYLSGMPSRKRKLVQQSRGAQSLPAIINETVREATTSSSGGSTLIPPDLTNVARDPSVRQAYREYIRALGHQRVFGDTDSDPERRPASFHYYLKNMRNAKDDQKK